MSHKSELMDKLDYSILKKQQLIETSFSRYVWRSVLATLYLSLGSAIAIGFGLKFDGSVGKTLYAFAFALGLMLIVFLNAELGTSNMMYMTVARYRQKLTTGQAAKILAVCVLFNLIGAVVCAYLLAQTGAFKGLASDNFLTHIVVGKMEKTIPQTLIEAIFANVIVNLAVMMSLVVKGDAGRIMAIILVISIFTFLGFEHVIANFIYFPLAIFTSNDPIQGLTVINVATNVIVTFVGNFIGGGLIIGLGYAWLNKDLSVKYLD